MKGWKAHCQKYGIVGKDRRRLFNALATLIDFAQPIDRALRDATPLTSDHTGRVIAALKILVDGRESEFWR